MMSFKETFEVDSKGDIVLDSMHRFEMVEGADKVKQDLTVLMKTLKGSDFLNTKFGLDHMVIMNVGTPMAIDRAIKQALSQYPYIQNINSIDIKYDGAQRNVQITVSVNIAQQEQIIELGVLL